MRPLSNRHGGAHVGAGLTPAAARADARKAIAGAFAEEGLPPSACRRAASTYRVWVVAGPMSLGDAQEAHAAWEQDDWETALRHARPDVRAHYGLPPQRDPEDQ